MANIDLSKPGNASRPVRSPARPVQAYLMLAFGVFDLVQRLPIGVLFIVMGAYLLYRGRPAARPVPNLGPVGARRADEIMAPAPTALPDWWTVDQYRARTAPIGDAAQPAFPLVDLQGQVTGAVTRAELDQLPNTDTSVVRLRDVAQRPRHRPMVLVPRDSPVARLAGSVVQRGAIGVVVNADQHPLGVITSDQIIHASERIA
jgi:hypothetical protein